MTPHRFPARRILAATVLAAAALQVSPVVTGASQAAPTSTSAMTFQQLRVKKAPKPVVTTTAVTPEAFGAVGNGVADDTAALRSALASLKAGQTLYLAPGKVYTHSDILAITTAEVTINGGGTLMATREERSAVFVNADRVKLDGVTLSVASTTRRWETYEQMKLRLAPRDGIVINKVTINGSAAAGMYIGGATNFTISDVTVRNTRADAIHMTEAARDGRIIRPQIYNPGDDGVAVVSYVGNSAPVRRITVTSPRLYGQSWGRGISVVGGQDITYTDVYTDGSAGAAIYIASEASWNTMGVSNVLIDGGTLVNSNSNTTMGHGSILVFNSRGNTVVEGVTIRNMTIRNTTRVSGREVGLLSENGGQIRNVTMSGMSFYNANQWLVLKNTSVSGLNLSTFARDGAAVSIASASVTVP